MKTYSLKNKEAFEQISKLCPSFPDKLRDACERELDEDGVEVTIYIRRDDLEIVKPYNPNEWNAWPGVTPPCNELLRCETIDRKGDVYHYCAKFDGTRWYEDCNNALLIGSQVPNRFRAWE